MTSLASQIRKGRKFDQVLEGARDVFMADGFEGASVDDIARTAGVSKATLYSYFPDKRLLFMEVAKTECRRQAEVALDEIDFTAAPRDVLTRIARRMTGFFLSDLGQRVFRICVAESDRFPEIGREFYENGPALVRSHLVDYFKEAIARGELKIDDFNLAAEQFNDLCKADLFVRFVFGMATSFSEDEINRVINGAVDMFMARYGVKQGA
jgi:AcrR family transcriptional regulator